MKNTCINDNFLFTFVSFFLYLFRMCLSNSLSLNKRMKHGRTFNGFCDVFNAFCLFCTNIFQILNTCDKKAPRRKRARDYGKTCLHRINRDKNDLIVLLRLKRTNIIEINIYIHIINNFSLTYIMLRATYFTSVHGAFCDE